MMGMKRALFQKHVEIWFDSDDPSLCENLCRFLKIETPGFRFGECTLFGKHRYRDFTSNDIWVKK